MSVLIIAEAGVNAGCSLDIAKQLAKAAKDAGADVVKFQTAIVQLVISRYAPKAEYQKKTANEQESQLEMAQKLHLTFDQHTQLAKYCKEIGIPYASTPFDLESLAFLETLDMPFLKIPSGEITNLPYLEAAAATDLPIILSTGMCELFEVGQAVLILHKNDAKSITLLHCNTGYPTPFCDVNLMAIKTLNRKFGLPVGYSDHTIGTEAAVAAVALGAVVIEKHFTLDKNAQGPDHKASLEPQELRRMITEIRNIESAIGNGIKTKTPSECGNVVVARKSIVAKTAITKGEVLTAKNICIKRPGGGINPMSWYDVLGTVSKRDFLEDEAIEV